MSTAISLSFPDATYTESNKPSVDTLKSDLSLVENGHNDHVNDATLHFLASTLYPVGSIYINAGVATNPATLLGFGTWTAFGAGKMMIGIDGTDTDFDSLSDTGGAKTATLAETNLAAHTHTGPSHTHTGPSHTHTGTTGGQSATHTHSIPNTWHVGNDDEVGGANINSVRETFNSGNASGDHTHNITTAAAGTGATGASGTGATGSAGSATAFSIMNPYVTAYMWKRTA